MKQYWCLIKSLCEAPDWEREIEAPDDTVAIRMLMKMAMTESDRMIKENTVELLPGGKFRKL